ncbi:MAG: helix-turn-helix transcriptional regulator [Massiliimalia sp.]|jgi:AraC-like DNA-binding protein
MNSENHDILLKQNLEVKLLAINDYYPRSENWKTVVQKPNVSELFYIASGKATFLLQGEKVPVTEDDILLLHPEISGIEILEQNEDFLFFVLAVEGLSCFFQSEENIPYYLHNYQSRRKDLKFYFQILYQETAEHSWGYQLVCQNILELILINMIRYSDLRFSVLSSGRAGIEIIAVKQYLDTHFRENVSLDLLAGQVHINKFHLSHSFKQAFGISPIQYLIDRRITESKMLLGNTDYSLSQIAEIVGFSSPSYFTQIFKKNTGLTPKEYRGTEKQK